MFSVSQLRGSDLKHYLDFTYPYFRHILEAPELPARWIALGASMLGVPVGLGLAEISVETARMSTVHSIAVSPGHRRLGIGTALLRSTEAELAKQGCEGSAFKYSTHRPSTAAVQALLLRNNWPAAVPRMLLCESDFETITRAPWIAERRMPAEFSLFRWVELSSAERADILERQRQRPWFNELLTPFFQEHRIEPVSSLGLRYKGEIVGWCISLRVSIDTIQYVRLFVREDLQPLGRAISLLANSIYCHANTEVNKAKFDVAMHNSKMFNFVQRRMMPYLKNSSFLMRSFKRLDPCMIQQASDAKALAG